MTALVRAATYSIPVLDWFPEAYQELSSWLLLSGAHREACVVREGWPALHPDLTAVTLALAHGFSQDHIHIK